MKALQLVKYDILSVFKSPLSYLGLLLTLLPIAGIITMYYNGMDGKIEGKTILGIFSWFTAVLGLLFIIKTITRDMSHGTIQLFLNSTRNRISYFMGKFISIVIIGLLFSGLVVGLVKLIESMLNGDPVGNDVIWHFVQLYMLLFVTYGLLLFLINIAIQKPAVIFTLGIFCILIAPIAIQMIPMIPEYGDDIKDVLKYIPFSYIIEKVFQAQFELKDYQIWIALGSIIVLFVLNLVYISKKDN